MADVMKGIYNSLGGEVHLRYYDLIVDKSKEENRTAEEIIDGIRDKLDTLSEV